MSDEDNVLRPAFRAIENSEADISARQTADALIAAHVSSIGKVYDQRRFAEAIAAAAFDVCPSGRDPPRSQARSRVSRNSISGHCSIVRPSSQALRARNTGSPSRSDAMALCCCATKRLSATASALLSHRAV